MATETATGSGGPDRDARSRPLAEGNEEAVAAWNGVLFERWLQFREIVTDGLAAHGEEALRAYPPKPGDRVLDIGCGLGDTTERIAELVGPRGEAIGIDSGERFIATAGREAAEAGLANVRFVVGDVQTAELPERVDYAFARFGTMFFANPVMAMRNVHRSLVPGGRLCMVVWRRKLDNDWLHRGEVVVKAMVVPDPESEELTCGPGPFSLADADTTSAILTKAGFAEITLRRCDLAITIGRDLDEAVALVTALGPAGEAIRLAGEQARRIRPQIDAALREALSEFSEPGGGIRAPASTWIVTARASG